MKFGKLDDVSQVNFDLPPDHPRTTRVLAHASKSPDHERRVYLGATGWSNQEWVGSYYPAKSKPAEFLAHYSRMFNTIEHNTTHYRIPDHDLVQRWESQSAADFVFCPKIPQQISHRARLNAEEPTLRFAEVMTGLGLKLGPCFIQLPDYHGPQGLALMQGFLRQWPREAALHWELRNPDWFSADGGPAGEGFDALEAAGHGTVITDVAGRRDVLHMQLTTPVLLLRFVGNGLHASDYVSTDAWIRRLADWWQRGLRAAYIFIHQPELAQVPPFTAYWARGLNAALGTRLRAPQPIPPPAQAGIQGSLF
jgi:uncharacterized protein YecE (DUF72 family)